MRASRTGYENLGVPCHASGSGRREDGVANLTRGLPALVVLLCAGAACAQALLRCLGVALLLVFAVLAALNALLG